MEPVRSNLTSKTCIDPISSNCIDWAGPRIAGTCGKATLTDVVTQIAENSNCCEGSFPAGHVSCYTGSWVNFASSILASGTNTSCSWTVNTAISNFGPPQYKWEKNGDLKVRGGFRITVTPITNVGAGSVQLVSLSTTCFPTAGVSPQFNITAVDPLTSTLNSAVVLAGGIAIEPVTGLLAFGFSFTDAPLAVIISDISLGGTTFNLA